MGGKLLLHRAREGHHPVHGCCHFSRGERGATRPRERRDKRNPASAGCVTHTHSAGLLTRTRHEFLKYKPLSQHTGTTRARTGADWHTRTRNRGSAARCSVDSQRKKETHPEVLPSALGLAKGSSTSSIFAAPERRTLDRRSGAQGLAIGICRVWGCGAILS